MEGREVSGHPARGPFVALCRSMSSNRTTIMVYEDEKHRLDNYAESRMGHSDVPYRSIVVSLLEEVENDE